MNYFDNLFLSHGLVAAISTLITMSITFWLWTRKRNQLHSTFQHQLSQIEFDHAQAMGQVNQLLSEEVQRSQQLNLKCVELQTQIRSSEAAVKEKLEFMAKTEDQLTATFKAISSDLLTHNNKQFLDLAQQKFATLNEKAQGTMQSKKQEIDALVKPLQVALEKMNGNLTNIESSRKEAYGGLKAMVGNMNQTQKDLQKEAGRLVTALKKPTVRGKWGEIQLRRLAELSGMKAHCDFNEQVTAQSDDGKLRPDMVVYLPDNRNIVIDSKASMEPYMNALECEDAEQQTDFFKRQAAALKKHVGDLSKKQYWTQFEKAPDYIVLFVPLEQAFLTAMEHDPTLFDYAAERNVVFGTPTNLIALLKAIQFGWQQVTLAENAAHISEIGRELYDRTAKMIEHFSKLGSRLDGAMYAYNQAVGSFSSRVIPSLHKFKDLGASTTRELKPVNPIERTIHSVSPKVQLN